VLDRLPKDRSRHWVDARPFVCDSRYIPIGPEYAEYAEASFKPNRPILAAAAELTQRIFKDFRYDPRATTVATPVAEVLSNRRGVCQDFAHFQIACLRSLGLAARYVSGYLSTVPPPGKERMIGADASHAWVSLFCGDAAGWTWTRRTINWPRTGTFNSPGAETTTT
jgi:transglutaminase-like putative cysteine protease